MKAGRKLKRTARRLEIRVDVLRPCSVWLENATVTVFIHCMFEQCKCFLITQVINVNFY